MKEDGTFDRLTKKEILGLTREKAKLEKTLGGIREHGFVARCRLHHRCRS